MKKPREEGGVNMTPMIDVVFQLIIFFVCTAETLPLHNLLSQRKAVRISTREF